MENERVKTKLKNRITEIDLLRGIVVCFMMFDHFMFNVWGLMPDMFLGFSNSAWSGFCNLALSYWNWGVRRAVRYIVIFIFLALTGVSCSFSRNNLKRGLKLLIVAIGLTLATVILAQIMDDVDMIISFGILHCIAVTLILVALVELFTSNKFVFLIVGVAFMIFGAFFLVEEPVSYNSGNFFTLFFEQLIGLIMLGPDSFSLFFYGGQIFIGVFIGKLFYKERKPLIFKGEYKNNLLTLIGRHSLLFYVLHQVVITVVLAIILLLAGFNLAL